MPLKKFVKSNIIVGLPVSVFVNGSQVIGTVVKTDLNGPDPHIEIESADKADEGYIYAVSVSDSVIGYDPIAQKALLKKLEKKNKAAEETEDDE